MAATYFQNVISGTRETVRAEWVAWLELPGAKPPKKSFGADWVKVKTAYREKYEAEVPTFPVESRVARTMLRYLKNFGGKERLRRLAKEMDVSYKTAYSAMVTLRHADQAYGFIDNNGSWIVVVHGHKYLQNWMDLTSEDFRL